MNQLATLIDQVNERNSKGVRSITSDLSRDRTQSIRLEAGVNFDLTDIPTNILEKCLSSNWITDIIKYCKNSRNYNMG